MRNNSQTLKTDEVEAALRAPRELCSTIYEVVDPGNPEGDVVAVFLSNQEAREALKMNGVAWGEFPKYNEEDGVEFTMQIREREVGVYQRETKLLEAYTWRFIDPTGLDGKWVLLPITKVQNHKKEI